MKTIKFTLMGFLFACIVWAVTFYYGNYGFHLPSYYKKDTLIAITQIAPHPSLDKIRQGIVDQLREVKGDKLKINFQDAQGSITISAQIAQQFVSQNPAVIVPITTPSAQSVYAQAKEHNLPVIFSAITDPVAAKLAIDKYKGNFGITGVTDKPNVKEQIKLLKEFFDKKIKIGIIYNPGEINGAAHAHALGAEAIASNMEIFYSMASNTKEIAGAVLSLIEKVDVFLLPNDNTIISGLEAVLQTTNAHKKPVFASDPESVERGCVASIAPDQYVLGRQTGQMVLRFLDGTALDKITIEDPKKYVLSINHKSARHMGLSVPQPLLQKADHIFD